MRAPPRSTSIVERLAGAGADDALHVGEVSIFVPLIDNDQVAGLEARGLRGAAGCTVSTRAARACLP